ncbi:MULTISPECIES: hypothetical protein [unclassified Acinetobacter]|uniref:hypothetical protein n=1 Tax=unclassified Acinetobacter TaxID=196816 RepID=UPI001E348280|nr:MULTISPECIES: hypothetical protein [unclassified Acinetobacter]MCD0187673.1 hypothetical protein [Acinetobacter sp. PW68]GJC30595.1 hypothetical protein KAM392_05740 [Acinetobacter sp. KAM392]GJC33301.1 hypothetical protein KAM393_04700 [Acinetobacter sp. KAM393]GJC38949.1 hypothetical protein KAM395_04700 [Acinetobacter sp. KAM395]GJC67269.1 hypothetical protein KAM405_05740 [Acinetobacter sp. KAM405]
MKKYIYLCLILGMSLPNVYAASAEQYVLAVEEINTQYKQDIRQFLRGLNPQQQGFNSQQQQQFCGIVSRYVDRLYQAADENRAYLDRRYQNINKQDVIQQVSTSKEMQLLKKYQVNCDLK